MVQVLKKTKFAPGMFTKEEMDRKWEGYDKDKAVCGFMKQTHFGSEPLCLNGCTLPAGKGCIKPKQAEILGRHTECC